MASNLVGFQTRVPAPIAASLFGIADAACRWYRSRQDRRALATLSDTTLRDMGLVRGDVEREQLKPFWQAVDYDALETLRRRRPAGECR